MSVFVIFYCFTLATASPVDHGQGEIVGRVTGTSAILQSRLTQGTVLVNGDLPGSPGVARFELATNPKFEKSHKTRWVEASADNDYIIKVEVNDLNPP
jgi:alkaline phosphatase D